MEMLRRAIEISMLEEKSRKTEQMLINRPVLPERGMSDGTHDCL